MSFSSVNLALNVLVNATNMFSTAFHWNELSWNRQKARLLLRTCMDEEVAGMSCSMFAINGF